MIRRHSVDGNLLSVECRCVAFILLPAILRVRFVQGKHIIIPMSFGENTGRRLPGLHFDAFTSPLNLQAPGRRQTLYVVLKPT